MFSIIEHIEYLMTRHDCVTVPGWGAFIANYGAAGYDAERAVFMRPQRMIGFNASVNHNDGLLAQSLMRRESVSYDNAMRFIADSVASFQQQLATDGEVSMGRLGYFRCNQGQHIEFVPFSHLQANDQFFGLSDLEIATVSALEEQRAADEAAAVPAIVPKERNLFTRKVGRIAASVVVLIGLGVLLSTPVIVDRERPDMASIAPSVTAPHAQPLAPTVQDGAVSQTFTRVDEYQTIAETGNTVGKYYMVIATLRNQRELDAFKAANQSLVPYMKMLDYKGLTCVYVARSDDYGKLMNLRHELPEGLRDVWIYNR